MEQIAIAADRQLNSPPPFLKWAGGKRWLSSKVVHAVAPVAGRYIEPFLGSGAVFFALEPKKAILSDTNEELISSYAAVRNDPYQVLSLLKEHQRLHSVEYYYQIRAYKPRNEYRKAARFIYLNRTCWNGLYRVNLNGTFNVPIGTKSTVLLQTDDWETTAATLKSATLLCQDFEKSIDAAKAGDVVFADPPYTVKHNLNGFIKYNNALFSWDDQIRLRDALRRAKQRGARVVATNACHQSVRELYSEGFDVISLSRASVLAGASIHRGKYEELFIR
ncbi:DNA adenine methylase [Polaromonas sp. LjRoot131]|uniref:DNA adenine methylase n=1 Tax=Polaromonas sp. LjRoot131 TaxID=3342262 RepID=UPI003ECE66FD